MKRKKSEMPQKPISLGRHETNCKVCQHPDRVAIEEEFVSWKSPTQIAKDWELRDRTTLYRHAWATGMMDKRRRNVRAALESIIERGADVEVTAAAFVQAVVAYSRINSEGRLVDRSERVDLKQLFERMSQQELQQYAESGHLPDWFEGITGKIENTEAQSGARNVGARYGGENALEVCDKARR
jgi:hypothetical protein